MDNPAGVQGLAEGARSACATFLGESGYKGQVPSTRSRIRMRCYILPNGVLTLADDDDDDGGGDKDGGVECGVVVCV